MMYFCCDQQRQNKVRNDKILNGIYYLEVDDAPGQPVSQRQRTLFVHFLNPDNPPKLGLSNVVIEGGERIKNIQVISATIEVEGFLKVEVDKAGDFSVYTLCLVENAQSRVPPKSIDLMFSAIDFSFKVECPSDFDCQPQRVCQSEPVAEPEIDYLARDYSSYQRMMLDRMANILPDWQERHAADQGNMLVELLSHQADHFSYELDAVATEAYIGTARRRISVRRHARLVDYFMHEGCNARAWVQVLCNGTNVTFSKHNSVNQRLTTTKLLTRTDDFDQNVIQPGSEDHIKIMNSKPVVFELKEDALLFSAHNEILFYTWENRECCLPKGSTSAYLKDDKQNRLRLMKGDVLIIEELRDPRTGQTDDADPEHRHAVRLTHVHPEVDYDKNEKARNPGSLVKDPINGQAYVKIEWHPIDALPFPVCISSIIDADHRDEENSYFDKISVVRGNIVLADHGMTLEPDIIGTVPEPEITLPVTDSEPCDRKPPVPVFPRFRPALSFSPLTYAAPYDSKAALAEPATRIMQWSMQQVEPQFVSLESVLEQDNKVWTVRRDLINSRAFDTHFIVEREHDGTVYLRFGDGEYGTRPRPKSEYTATYRVGNGKAGNIPVDALTNVVTNQIGIKGIRNLLPARGGAESESVEDVRQKAPVAFRRQQRAVTEKDYARVTQRQDNVQKAVATFRWTGSWHTVFITADRDEGLGIDKDFAARTRGFIERFRMAGHDLEVDTPRFVPLKIEMFVCVKADYFRSQVKKALLDVFSSQYLSDGRRGFFHHDNWTFGQSVYLSPLYAAAQAVVGVASVHIRHFERFYAPGPEPLKTGELKIGRLEIAGLYNDRNYPERGVLQIDLGGGK